MFDEEDFVAAKFWKSMRKMYAASERGSDLEFDRTLLQMLFIVAEGDGHLWFTSEKAVAIRELLDSPDDRAFTYRWDQFTHEIRDYLAAPNMPDEFSTLIDRTFFSRTYHAMQAALVNTPLSVPALFDYVFFASATNALGVSPRYASMVARFSSLLAPKEGRRVEAFALTGEFLSANVDDYDERSMQHPAIVQSMKGWTLLLQMRLALNERRSETLIDGHDGFFHLRPGDFLLIDAPRRQTTLSHRAFQTQRTTSNARSAFQMLDVLMDRNHFIDGVVMVRGTDRTAAQESIKKLRQWLVESGSLVAVIDFPSGSRNLGSTHSAWVLRAHPKITRDQVLMADMRVLLPEDPRRSWNSLATFAAQLVHAWEGEGDHQWIADAKAKSIDKRLLNIFLREFDKGYRDVGGLCAGISRTKLLKNGSRLQAYDHLASQKPRAWASGLDSRCIVQILASKRMSREPIYVIGNNGEGKSLLLRELADYAIRERRTTIGVAFGFNDRFLHRDQKSQGYEFFRYEGARSSASSASGKKIALDMGKKMLEIHCAPHRLEAFTMGLELLEFRARRYLIPFTSGAGKVGIDSVVSATVEMSDVAEHNVNLVEPATLANMQPALGRMQSGSEIIAFSELSSGEQQMLALMVKVVVAAEPGALILIDEPEISLHVTWQRLLPVLLGNMSKHFDCDMVIATHSPILVTSALNTGTQCFVAKDQTLTLLSARERGSVERVLFTGFNTHTENNRQVHERCASIVAEAIEAVNSRGKKRAVIDGLYLELLVMKNTVSEAIGQLRENSLGRDLDLIDKTREALDQLRLMAVSSKGGGR